MTTDACPAGNKAVALPLAIDTDGVTLLSRKPEGYDTVMVEAAGNDVAVENVTITSAAC
jgi:hypothetical protein